MFKKLKENWIIFALCALFLQFAYYNHFVKFNVIGNKKTHVYHVPHCPIAERFYQEERIKFRNPEEAVENDYRPCKFCLPPTETPEIERDPPEKRS